MMCYGICITLHPLVKECRLSLIQTLMNIKETLTSMIQMLNVMILLGAMSASAELAILAMDSIVQVCSCHALYVDV